MKRLAILLALLALPAVVGCGSSSEAKSSPSAAKKKKPTKKKKTEERTHPKGYKPPQKVWGGVMYESYMEDLKSSDPKKRASACVGLFNMRSGAVEALPELKKIAKSDKDTEVRKQAKRAIKAIEDS